MGPGPVVPGCVGSLTSDAGAGVQRIRVEPNLLIRSYRQAQSDWLFQQVTGPYPSARVHPYAPGLLYSAAVPVRSSTGRAWPRSRRWSTLASTPLPTLPVPSLGSSPGFSRGFAGGRRA
jgi:hypothetical protein